MHGPNVSYKVLYAVNHYPESENRKSNTTTANEIVLDGLEKNLEYLIFVLIRNLIGDGPESRWVFCSTEEDGKMNYNFEISSWHKIVNSNFSFR